VTRVEIKTMPCEQDGKGGQELGRASVFADGQAHEDEVRTRMRTRMTCRGPSQTRSQVQETEEARASTIRIRGEDL
jgi:hypothetical protein